MLKLLHTAAAILVIAAALYAFWTMFKPNRQFVLRRAADHDRWSRVYSGEDLATANEALAAVTSAFLLRADDAARLQPDDKLMDIYRTAYPLKGTPDALEFESLWKVMQQALQVTEAELQRLPSMTVQQVIDAWLHARRRRPTKS